VAFGARLEPRRVPGAQRISDAAIVRTRRYRATFLTLLTVQPPNVNQLTTKLSKHFLNHRISFSRGAEVLLRESLFFLTGERLSVIFRILDVNSYTRLLPGNFLTYIAQESDVFRARQCVTKVASLRSKLDIEFARFKRSGV